MKNRKCFRPLIRGFFFYDSKKERDEWVDKNGFRPLIRGFFFYVFPFLDYIL